MTFNFKYLGNIDVSSIQQKLGDLDWDAYTFRQTKHEVHQATKTVPLIFDPNLNLPLPHRWMTLFISELEQIKSHLKSILGEGSMMSAILINLPSGQVVHRHVDKGESFKKYNRIHIAIETNTDCIFEVDGEEKHLKIGEVWEIDNSNKYHSVRNEGSTDRIHLLIDWLLK